MLVLHLDYYKCWLAYRFSCSHLFSTQQGEWAFWNMKLYHCPHSPLLTASHLRVKSKVCIRADDVHHDCACHCPSSFISGSLSCLPYSSQNGLFAVSSTCQVYCQHLASIMILFRSLSHLENFNILLPFRSHIPCDHICFGTHKELCSPFHAFVWYRFHGGVSCISVNFFLLFCIYYCYVFGKERYIFMGISKRKARKPTMFLLSSLLFVPIFFATIPPR